MITRVTSMEELKQLLVEVILNKTNKITKISNESILNGISYGIGKVSQKALKDIALVETHLFPDYAFGPHLDEVAQKQGISPRYTATPSSTYVRVVGQPGTVYTAGIQVFSGAGVQFDLMETVILNTVGFAYAQVKSQTQGTTANVEALTINKVTPVPTGHVYCVNEYRALGGRDLESDSQFRLRIKENANIIATGTTVSKITQVFNKINPNIFKVVYQGINQLLQPILAVVTVNGADLTPTEIESLLQRSQEYLSLYELPFLQGAPSLEIRNIEYQAIDIAYRVQIQNGAQLEVIRKRTQIAMSKYLDWRYWVRGNMVEWDNLLEIAKSDPQVDYVPDTYFTPNSDVPIDVNKLPRLRGFILMDMDGNIIENNSGTLNPVFYPSDPNLFFQTTALSSI